MPFANMITTQAIITSLNNHTNLPNSDSILELDSRHFTQAGTNQQIATIQILADKSVWVLTKTHQRIKVSPELLQLPALMHPLPVLLEYFRQAFVQVSQLETGEYKLVSHIKGVGGGGNSSKPLANIDPSLFSSDQLKQVKLAIKFYGNGDLNLALVNVFRVSMNSYKAAQGLAELPLEKSIIYFCMLKLKLKGDHDWDARAHELAYQLIKAGAQINNVIPDSIYGTLLHLCCSNERYHQFGPLLIQAGHGVNVLKDYSRKDSTPIKILASNLHKELPASLELLQALIDAGAKVHKELLCSVELSKGTQSAMKILLTAMVKNVNEIDEDGNTLLHSADSAKLVAELIEIGADVNAQNNDGATPLFEAVGSYSDTSEKIKIIKCLLKAHADPNLADKKGNFPLLEACRENNKEAILLLLKHQAEVKSLFIPDNFNTIPAPAKKFLIQHMKIDKDMALDIASKLANKLMRALTIMLPNSVFDKLMELVRDMIIDSSLVRDFIDEEDYEVVLMRDSFINVLKNTLMESLANPNIYNPNQGIFKEAFVREALTDGIKTWQAQKQKALALNKQSEERLAIEKERLEVERLQLEKLKILENKSPVTFFRPAPNAPSQPMTNSVNTFNRNLKTATKFMNAAADLGNAVAELNNSFSNS